MQPEEQHGYWQPDGQQPPLVPTPVQPAQQVTPVVPITQQQPAEPLYRPQPVQQTIQPQQQPVQVQPQPQPVATPAQQQPLAQPAPQPTIQQPPSPQQFQPQATQPVVQEFGPVAMNEVLEENLDEDVEEYEDIDLTEPVNWEASEYIHQEKDVRWFVLFGIILVGLIAAAIFLMDSWTFVVLLVVIAAAIIVFAKRPPRIMNYSLSDSGLHIGDTLHRFADYKSFGIIRDGEEFSVMLIPIKRFQPGITVYFPEESGEAIVDMLGSRLPIRELHLDAVDKLVRKLRL